MRDDERYQSGLLLFSVLGVVLAYFEWEQGPWLEPAFAEPNGPWFQMFQWVGLALWPEWMVWAWWKGRN